ncbi:predicted protein [Histoplasma mississippiense (nom. inval.)]|uniref:predicted protein n=1 Tax=Ajellomyces capsulatus (strain NAm1 / WU24) TaxID=2059318 RepID=UPI000157B409|nr:predicted protein [Histoplasma mississippiense (nom. inval.)]EDN02530.1 predicted protein [Histoplasma mississippiense (nom. inval.)]
MTPSLREHSAAREIPEPLSEDREESTLEGDTECESDSEASGGRNREAMSAQDLEGESQAQPQLGSRPTGPARSEPEAKAITASKRCLGGAGSNKENVAPLSPQSIPTGVADNVSGNKHSKDTHAAVGDSFACRFEPDTSGLYILLYWQAKDKRLEFLLWPPIWRSEDDVAKVAPDQLK